jgi:dihydrodipicolinate synthase/N-acetylneuraminate lyase
MAPIGLLCRNLTTFTRSKELDEDAFRQFLQRMVDSKVGLYMASGGSGEGHSLRKAELLRLYKIGVEVCKGKVPVNANLPEQATPWETIEQAELAVEAGVDLINLYGPASRHSYRATAAETTAYFEAVLDVIKYPVAIAPNVMVPTPEPALMADIANRYPQVMAVMAQGQDDHYYIALRNMIHRDIPINVQFGHFHPLLLGANAVITNQASILPKTYRRYVDLFNDGRDREALGRVYEEIMRFDAFVGRIQGTPRWLKMCLKVLKLPGGDGGVRPPYLLPSDEEIERFGRGLIALNVPEIEEMAVAAGLVNAPENRARTAALAS